MSRTVYLLLTAGFALAACAPTPAAPSLNASELAAFLAGKGLTAKVTGSIDREFFSVPGTRMDLGEQEVQIYEYPDEAGRAAESSRIQPDGAPNPTTSVMWVDQPNFWAHGRLIVFYLGRDPSTIALLTEALGEPLTQPWPAE